MIFKTLAVLLLLLIFPKALGAECTAYEKLHPRWPLTGAHLSTGKCTSCGMCHIPEGSAVWIGTPRTCIACHNGDPSRMTIGRSARHLPTLLLDCAGCHNTMAFTNKTGITQLMIHTTGYPTVMCKGCHNGMYTSYGAQGMSNDHPKTVTRNGVKIIVAAVDCNYSGCHNPNSNSFN
jgi:hypothetical protein